MMTFAILGFLGQFEIELVFPQAPKRQADYERMIKAGQSERLAEMLAAQQPPGLGMTTVGFLRGRHHGGIGDPEVDARYRSIAEASGVSPVGKVYSSPLASYPGDPEAWVSSPSDAKEVAERKNLKLEGSISYTPARFEEPVGDENVDLSGKYEVAADLISDELEVQAEANPELIDQWKAKPQTFEDAKEKTKETLSGN